MKGYIWNTRILPSRRQAITQIKVATPLLTSVQKERLARLEPQLQQAALAGNLQLAKSITLDIQNILRPTGHETRLMQSKNWLFEAAMEAGEYSFAIEGLKGVRLKVNNNTRLHLEASALLAICYLRINDLESAKPIIRVVLQNDKVIKSSIKREIFRKSMIERFDEEIVLFSLKNKGSDELNKDEIHSLAIDQAKNSTDIQIYYFIGNNLPENTIKSLYKIDDFSKRQLPSAEKLKLPSAEVATQQENIGRTFFSSVKRTLYKSLCDPESEIYKAWFNEGIKSLLDKKYITGAVVAAMSGLGIGIKALAASIVALILKFGIEVYCTHNKPSGVMEMR